MVPFGRLENTSKHPMPFEILILRLNLDYSKSGNLIKKLNANQTSVEWLYLLA